MLEINKNSKQAKINNNKLFSIFLDTFFLQGEKFTM